MKLKTVLESNKFTLEVTMPQSIEFVQAVLDGGAQALKMRCNPGGHTSRLHAGIDIGTFQEQKPFLEQVVDMAGDVPVGLVPGMADNFVTEEEIAEIEEMGISYINTSPMYIPCYAMENNGLDHVLAITDDNHDIELVRELGCDSKTDAVEVNVVPDEEKGTTALPYGDILKYRSAVRKLDQPVIATGQRIVKPSEIRYFYEAGCKSFMLGVVGFLAAQEEYGGGELTPETCKRLTSEFREAVEKL